MRIQRPTRVVALVAAVALLGTAIPAAHAAPAEDPGGTEVTGPAPDTETPALVEGLDEPVDAALAPDKAAKDHLEGHRSRYKIVDPDTTLVTAGVQRDGARETVRLDQRYKKLPVLGGQYVVRMEKRSGERTVTGTSGSYFTELDVDTTAKTLPAAKAVDRAVEGIRKSLSGGAAVVAGQVRPGTAPSAVEPDLTGTDAGLAIVPAGTGVLARHVVVRGAAPVTGEPVLTDVYVDAATGAVLLSSSRLRTLAAPQASLRADLGATAAPGAASVTEPPPSGNGLTPVVGKGTKADGTTVDLRLQRVDATGDHLTMDLTHTLADGRNVPITTWDATQHDYYDTAGMWPEGIAPFASRSSTLGTDLTEIGAVDAHWAAAQVFEYYKVEHGRDSLDDAGMAIDSFVGITYGGYPFVNAFWDGTKMVYGTGDAEYKSLASDLDVVGHEMTHGVVEHTAGFLYSGQQGALNEAIADYFGNAIDVDVSGTPMSDPGASLLGGDLCRTTAPDVCALRDLDDGMTTADFNHLIDTDPRFDYGGVHLNSTIVSGALWDVREALGGDLADKVVYRALTEYLTPLSDFVDGREAVVAAARSYGLKGRQLRVVERAFDSRGVTEAWEKSLPGRGTSLLLDRLDTGLYTDMQPSTAGGWWAVPRSSADGSEPTSIWVGRTDGRGEPRQVSADDGRTSSFAHTDGKRVVWLSVAADYSDFRIMSAPLTGGYPKELYRTTSYVSGLGMDGGVTSWSEANSDTWMDEVRYLTDSSPTVHTVEHDWFGPATAPTVRAGKIAYVRYEVFEHEDGSWDWALGVEVYDTRSGKTALAGLDTGAESVTYPALTTNGAYWVTDLDPGYTEAGAWHNSVRAYSFATGKSKILFEETSPEAKRAWVLTASDNTLTVTEDAPMEEWMNATLPSDRLMPRLVQYTLDGKYVGAASCSPGAQMFASAGDGRAVVFKSTATSVTGLAIASGVKHCK
ncbi:Zn-dependent metalloprotease [Promicromonospora sp. AC04]|uniref:M4 family metallopeptidase n=1 Tax=Promicromonospora sp. AC04 TaxID=2135723 RepID=UPI000D4A2A2E|nr:M4 family metallopeptidase [Promicromonospora sp. AC04]PUB29814.1 Zn-dependent metalloprotease [Promicromonospora sp. AC04]